MADKDLLVVISEMLRKQGQHAELIRETNGTLKQFMDVSIKQFEQQHQFNLRQEKFNERQEKFNEQFLGQNISIVNRLDSIEGKLTQVLDINDRLKRLEAAVFK